MPLHHMDVIVSGDEMSETTLDSPSEASDTHDSESDPPSSPQSDRDVKPPNSPSALVKTSPSLHLIPTTPIKHPSTLLTLSIPPAPPSTPCLSPALLRTPNATPIRPCPSPSSYSNTPSNSITGTPSSRTRLLSPRPLWHSATKTLKRAASFASFGGERHTPPSERETRRTSSEPQLEVSVPQSTPRKKKEDRYAQDHHVSITAPHNTPSNKSLFVKALLSTTASGSQTASPCTPTKRSGYQALPSSPTSPDPDTPGSDSPGLECQSPVAISPLQEIRASVMSNSSELSAQWYRSPRERLGLYLTVTKRGPAPWVGGKGSADGRKSGLLDSGRHAKNAGYHTLGQENDSKGDINESQGSIAIDGVTSTTQLSTPRRSWRNLWLRS